MFWDFYNIIFNLMYWKILVNTGELEQSSVVTEPLMGCGACSPDWASDGVWGVGCGVSSHSDGVWGVGCGVSSHSDGVWGVGCGVSSHSDGVWGVGVFRCWCWRSREWWGEGTGSRRSTSSTSCSPASTHTSGPSSPDAHRRSHRLTYSSGVAQSRLHPTHAGVVNAWHTVVEWLNPVFTRRTQA